MLAAMARQFEINTGRPPKTVEEIADHWYELSDRIVIKEHVDEEGCHHPAETLFEVDAPDHCLQCIWLRDVEKRPDAAAMLAEATRASEP
jgi:hypothetical protein